MQVIWRRLFVPAVVLVGVAVAAFALARFEPSGWQFAASAAGPDDPFVVAYRDATTRTPTALEAAAVDLGRLLALASRSDADTRAAVRDALLRAQPTDTVTGLVGFDDATLRMERRMLILTITRSTIEKVGEVTFQD